jgi:hypothetical protein
MHRHVLDLDDCFFVHLTALPLTCAAKARVQKPSGEPVADARRDQRRAKECRRLAAARVGTAGGASAPDLRRAAAGSAASSAAMAVFVSQIFSTTRASRAIGAIA